MAAVVTRLASTQLAPVAETRTQYGLDTVAGRADRDVMDVAVPDLPGPDRGGRAGEAAVVDGHDLVDLRRRASTTPGRCRSAQPPGGRRAGHRDVAAEAHEHARTDAARRCGPRPGRRPGPWRSSRGRAGHPAGCGRCARRGSSCTCAIAGDRPERPGRRRGPGPHLVEVGVVAERGDGVADGRVDGARRCARPHRRATRERLEEQRADAHGAPGVRRAALQLRVGRGSGCRRGRWRRARRRSMPLGRVGRGGVLHHDRRRGADGPEGAGGQRRGVTSGAAVSPRPTMTPDVTVGVVVVLEVGAVESCPVFPVDPCWTESPEPRWTSADEVRLVDAECGPMAVAGTLRRTGRAGMVVGHHDADGRRWRPRRPRRHPG